MTNIEMARHFLCLMELTPHEIRGLLSLASRLKQEWLYGGNRPILRGKVMGMIFQKPSLRTRVSFEMAMRHLGGDALYLSPSEIGLGKRESIADVSRVLSGYVDILMARVFEYSQILELARYSSVPVINGLSDYNHPCQALADLFTLQELFADWEDLKIAYIGDGNNMATSLLHICAKLGLDMSIASPKGYVLKDSIVAAARIEAKQNGSAIHLHQDPEQAVAGADVVYTDTWTSMGQEEESALRDRAFSRYQLNAALLRKAKPTAVVMHCLPAHRGKEITDDVADGPQSIIFRQAENRLHAQKAVIAHLLTSGT
jgi:ornithine carbamoyltransferase